MRSLLQAAPRGTYGWVCNFIGRPAPGSEWHGRPYRGGGELEQQIDGWQRFNTYYSVAALRADSDGEEKRRKQNFVRLLSLVVDDADPADIMGRPSYVLATSPGKNQVGFFLDAHDDDCANQPLVDAVMRVLFERRLIGGDPSGNNGVRYVRLPVGQNQKPRDSGHFDHQVVFWNPEQRLTLADALAALGVDIDELRERVAQQAQTGIQLGPGADQGDKLAALVGNVVRGLALHESMNEIAASLVASGMHGGSIVNLLRGLMTNSLAARDDRWQDRYNDIPRSVRTAEEKFRQPAPMQPLAADVGGHAEHQQKQRLIVRFGDVKNTLGHIDWLIRGYIERSAVSMLFGPPGVGKSFVAIDQACCVATGTPWHGNPVKQGPVVIVAGEGQAGLVRRITAWGVQNGKTKEIDEAPIHFTVKAVPLLDIDKVAEMVAEIDEICGSEMKPSLVVIDTLARNFGAGDENKAQDANAFIAAVDTYIKHRYRGCHVLIVHHSGIQAGRERGSSAFRAAVDQLFEVKSVGGFIAYQCHKMKDAEIPAAVQFSLIGGIVLGGEAGDEILGAALKPMSSPLSEVFFTQRATESTPKIEIKRRDFLSAIERSWIPWADLIKRFGLNADAKGECKGLKNACKRLSEEGWVSQREGSNFGYQLTDAARLELSHTGANVLGETQGDANEY